MLSNISDALSEGYKCSSPWWYSFDMLRTYLLLILFASFPGRTVSPNEQNMYSREKIRNTAFSPK